MTLINYARAIILGCILAGISAWWFWPTPPANPCATLTREYAGFIGVKPGPIGSVLKIDTSCPSQARWVKADIQ